MAGKSKTLHHAATSGDTDIIRQLLDAIPAPDVNVRNDRWETALYCACMAGHVNAAQLLLTAGARVNARARKRFTPLHAAARFGHTEVIDLLVGSGAGIERATIRKMTPLALATRYGHSECVRLLLAHGATPVSFDMFGRTPLHWAVKTARDDIVELLIAAGADLNVPDRFGKTPVMQAAKSGRVSLLRRLVVLGIDATVPDRLLREPIHIVAEHGHARCLAVLLDVSALSANRSTGKGQGKSVLMFAASRGQECIVRLLLKRGANPNQQDGWGLTALGHVVTGRLGRAKARTAACWHRTALALIRYGNADVSIPCCWPCSWDYEDRDAASTGDAVTPERTVCELAFRAGYEDLVRPLMVAAAGAALPRRLRALLSTRTEELPEYVRQNTTVLDYVRRFVRSPRPLRELARRAVRLAVGAPDFERRLDSLQLAPGMRAYLMYSDLVIKMPPGFGGEDDDDDEVEDFEALEVDDKVDSESDTEEEMEPSVFDSDLYGDNEPLDSDTAGP